MGIRQSPGPFTRQDTDLSTLSLQTKLAVGAVDDPLEQDADRIADQVMRVPLRDPSPQLRRACARCEADEEKLQRAPSEAAKAVANEVPPIVHEALRSPGEPLDDATRGYFEPRFRHDFSRVRVHTGRAAEQSARDVRAHAYTVGHDIVFGAGQYAPGTREGRRLLAHELVHVTQQEAAGGAPGPRIFRDKDEGKPQPPPPKAKPPPPPAAATPCIPKFKSLKAEITSTVGARDVNGRCEIILGTPGKANGTTFTSTVDVPAGCTGTLQYVQLVDMCRLGFVSKDDFARRATEGDWIDTQDPIDQQQVSSAGSVEFKSNDSPAQPVPVAGPLQRVHLSDRFKIWLMWKPDQPADAGRVPLAMATWSWSADAEVKKPDEEDCAKRWSVTQQKTTGGTGKATKDAPAATKTVTSADPPTEKGKKC